MLNWLRRILGPPHRRRWKGNVPRQAALMIRAAYDAAQTTGENRRHWQHADYLSPVAAATFDVRRLIRSRARYEVANNSIARGIVLTLANDLVATGPRLQLQTDDRQLNRRLEGHFAEWAGAVNLAGKLRTMRVARAQDGETFGVLFTNRQLRSPVKLDVRLIEADRVTTPTTTSLVEDERQAVDGIVFDRWGNPTEYHVLQQHPGASKPTMAPFEAYDRIPARNVVHWFRADRPEQRRGLPDLMPALPLFALLRRFVLATLTAAETAADLSIIMKTNAPSGGEAAEVEPHVTMELERNMALFAPEGWEPTQLRAEHPAETFDPFRKAIINEIARCMNVPYSIAAGDSSGHNYASGRLDHATYYKAIGVERGDLETVVLQPIFTAWLAEALRVADYGLFGHIERMFWPAAWIWSGREHLDPLKSAKGAEVLLKAGLLTEAQYYGQQGLDWEEMQEQRKVEANGREKRNLPPLEAVGARTDVWQVGDTIPGETDQ